MEISEYFRKKWNSQQKILRSALENPIDFQAAVDLFMVQQASKLKYRVIIVDGTISIQELFNEVCNYFGLGSETQTAIHQAE